MSDRHWNEEINYRIQSSTLPFSSFRMQIVSTIKARETLVICGGAWCTSQISTYRIACPLGQENCTCVPTKNEGRLGCEGCTKAVEELVSGAQWIPQIVMNQSFGGER